MTRTSKSQYNAKVAKKALLAQVKERGIPTAGFNQLVYTQNKNIKLAEIDNLGRPNPHLVRFLYGKKDMDTDGRLDGKKVTEPSTRRNPGRMDGVQWNGNSFVSPRKVDDGSDVYVSRISDNTEFDYSSEYDFGYEYNASNAERVHTVSLLDIAKPAKPKGVAKEFEVIPGPSRVITLDDFEELYETLSQDGGSVWEEADFSAFSDSDADWDSVYGGDDRVAGKKKSYSAAVHTGGG